MPALAPGILVLNSGQSLRSTLIYLAMSTEREEHYAVGLEFATQLQGQQDDYHRSLRP